MQVAHLCRNVTLPSLIRVAQFVRNPIFKYTYLCYWNKVLRWLNLVSRVSQFESEYPVKYPFLITASWGVYGGTAEDVWYMSEANSPHIFNGSV